MMCSVFYVLTVFTAMHVAAVDIAEKWLLEAERLQSAGAPVVEIRAAALEAASASPVTHATSAALLIIEVSPAAGQHATSGNHSALKADGGLLPAIARPQPVLQQEARVKAARLLGDLAAGRRAAARKKLADPNVEAVLRTVSGLMPGGLPAVRRDAALRDRQPRADDPWLAARAALLGWGTDWESIDTMSIRMDVDWLPVVELAQPIP
ncbi:MAG: hypothetical protein MK077_03860 [Phycisphaerales bacterium]|nr:hypothetical protein [Phycisphaerales bacterium]